MFRIDPRAIVDNHVAIDGPRAHHLAHVLRVRAGDLLQLTDGEGTTWSATIVGIARQRIQLTLGAAHTMRPPVTRITLAVALLPRDRWRIVVEKAVELGVDTIQPLLTARTVIRQTDRTPKQVAHWQAIADSAAEQCETPWWPQVADPIALPTLLGMSDRFDRVVCCQERLPAPTSAGPQGHAARLLCLIGPEGGWTDTELAALAAAHTQPLSLGPRILRAETAALAALIRLQHD